jgi:hypothetical protein
MWHIFQALFTRCDLLILLDPADPDDPALISFNMLGHAIVPPELTDTWEIERAKYSIERGACQFGGEL